MGNYLLHMAKLLHTRLFDISDWTGFPITVLKSDSRTMLGIRIGYGGSNILINSWMTDNLESQKQNFRGLGLRICTF